MYFVFQLVPSPRYRGEDGNYFLPCDDTSAPLYERSCPTVSQKVRFSNRSLPLCRDLSGEQLCLLPVPTSPKKGTTSSRPSTTLRFENTYSTANVQEHITSTPGQKDDTSHTFPASIDWMKILVIVGGVAIFIGALLLIRFIFFQRKSVSLTYLRNFYPDPFASIFINFRF